MKYLVHLLIFTLFIPQLIVAQTEAEVEKAVLDLRKWDYAQQKTIALDGKWEFYWKQFLTTKTLHKSVKKAYIEVPKKWTKHSKNFPSKGYATYRIHVILPKNFEKALALKIPSVGTSYRLYIDDKLLQSNGNPAKSIRKVKPDYTTHVVHFTPTQQSFDIIFQVANYHHRKAGLWRSIYLGTLENIIQKRERIIIINLFLVGSIFIMFLYHIGLYIVRPKASSALYFALSCLCIVFRILATDEYLITKLDWFSWFIVIRIEYISIFLLLTFFPIFLKKIFPDEINKNILKINTVVTLSFVTLDLILPVFYTTFLIPPFQILLLSMALYGAYAIILAVIRKRLGAKIILAGFIALIFTAINDILYLENIVNTGFLGAYGFFIFIFSQAFLISQKFSIAFKNSEIFRQELDIANQDLENKVAKRTEELQEAFNKLQIRNEELNQSQEEILVQRDFLNKQNYILDEKNKKVNSSIRSAVAIQRAILPYQGKLDKLLKDYFIINRPKDVVSGDFFWLNEIAGKTILIVADCTGHGVPGAFMTLIGTNLLDKIIRVWDIVEPAEILNRLHEEVQTVLQQKTKANNQNGMELVAVCWEKVSEQIHLSFAGAKNGIFLYLDNELKEVKGTRKAIGGIQNENIIFKQEEITLPTGTTIYLGSDGLEDQNNINRKKFGKKRLKELLQSIADLPLKTQQNRIEETLDTHQQGTEQRDDILWIGVKL